MTHKFIRQENTARRLIAKFGTSITFKRAGALNETTTPPTFGPPATYQANAVQTMFRDSDKDGENIRDGDIMLLVSTEGGYVPENGDKATIEGRKLSMVYVERISPAGTALLFKVRARGA